MKSCGLLSASRAVNIWLSKTAPRNITSVSGRSSPELVVNFIYGASGVLNGGRSGSMVGRREFQVRTLAALLRSMSSVAVKEGDEKKEFPDEGEEKRIVSYWGIGPRKLVKEDGTEWKWNCFMPWETYKSDTSIDVTKHHVPVTLMDKMAYWSVKALRWPTDVFFQRRYGCRAMMLETVAAVPGMV